MEFDRKNLSVARLGRQLLFHGYDVLRFLTSLAFGAPMLVPKLGKAVCFVLRFGRELSATQRLLGRAQRLVSLLQLHDLFLVLLLERLNLFN